MVGTTPRLSAVPSLCRDAPLASCESRCQGPSCCVRWWEMRPRVDTLPRWTSSPPFATAQVGARLLNPLDVTMVHSIERLVVSLARLARLRLVVAAVLPPSGFVYCQWAAL